MKDSGLGRHPDVPKGLLLIADDEEMNKLILVRRLQRFGYQTIEASNGAEAVATARSLCASPSLPLVILMDINMPVMDGFEATRILKSEWNGLPVIAVTASAVNPKEFLDFGFDALCIKPIDFKDLVQKIDRCIGTPPQVSKT